MNTRTTLPTRRRFRFARGQSAVELALAIPVLVLVLVAAADFGRVGYFALEVDNAARAGAQYGVQDAETAGNITGMENAAIADAANISNLTATAQEYCQCSTGSSFACNSGNTCTSDEQVYVEVDTSDTFHTLLTYPGFGSSITVNGKAVMREQ